MTRENFQIYTIQTTGKYICETFPPFLHDLVLDPMKNTPHKFLREKRSPIRLWGRRNYALSSYFLLFLKVSSLTSVVQTMALQNKTT